MAVEPSDFAALLEALPSRRGDRTDEMAFSLDELVGEQLREHARLVRELQSGDFRARRVASRKDLK